MAKTLIERLIASLLVVVGSLVLVFCIIYLLPGDPVLSMLDPASATPEMIANLRHQLGLDQPFYVQFGKYFAGVLQGDFGKSLINSDPVLPKILTHVPATLALTLASTVISVVVGVLLGVLSAIHRNRWIDIAARLVGLFGISMPTFWSGILLILIFSIQLNWFPAMGSEGVATLILPALTLGIVGAGFIVRMVRNSMLEVIHEPFIVTLRAKGLSEKAVMYRHALRNALIPAVTIIGIHIGDLMAGTVVVETVFSRQGVGRIIADAIMAKDLPVVQGVVFFSAVVYVAVNLLVDISYTFIDPRVRRSSSTPS
ncbi:ABC transporter permease [Paenibacillus rigui]|uniref:Peptide ABC transporter permease n=1 Tax=Paenibacillus rigui TaxID=554312 RepID=A0A229UTK0_9BACL|nr:ABC transporter permease [Paenibacillus rigui]OXM86219.1 peptide ABC transporter permease [Paenibacillus rigui]